MNILITGSNGFLGKSFVNLRNQYNCFTLNRSNSDYNCNLVVDVPKFKTSFDLVIHAAGKAHMITNSKFDLQLFHNVNVLGTINLLKGLENFKIPKKFIYISSVSVYGLVFGNNINEHTELNACDPYGKSKIDAENIILDWCEKHSIICTILRLPLLVGDNPPGNLGSMIESIKNGYYFNIAGGNARKSMVLTKDVANYILTVSDVGGIFNLTDGYHPSFFELSNYISSKFNKRKPRNLPFLFALILAKIGDLLGGKSPFNSLKYQKITSNLTFDDSKARTTFGWNPTSVLEGF